MTPDTLTKRASTPSRPRGVHRLADAFDAVARLPALDETIARIAALVATEPSAPGALADAVEADPAVAIAILRAANEPPGGRGRIGSVPKAIEALTIPRAAEIAAGLETYHLLEDVPGWGRTYEPFRLHSVSTRHAAERIADLGRAPDRDLVPAAALLHDIGRLVIRRLHPGYPELSPNQPQSPVERALQERRELGIDHCIVGGVLARRWGMPEALAGAIAGHHSENSQGLAAVVCLADLVVHHAAGNTFLADSIEAAASACSLSPEALSGLLYDFPHGGTPPARRVDPSPLSRREVDALRGLGAGKVYREIAEDMGLAPSTVRTHLHNVYRKIGAADRAQAVLIATGKGWL